MQLVLGVPTATIYDHLKVPDEEVINKWYADYVKCLKTNRDSIKYQTFSTIPGAKYCLAKYHREFSGNESVPIFYLIFARRYFEQAMAEFNEKIKSVQAVILERTPCWVEVSETAFHDKRYKVLYEEEDRPVNAEEIGLYLVKIVTSPDLEIGAKFVANYLTMVYVRLYCLGEPFMHYGREYDPDKDGPLVDYVINVSNRKSDGDRLVDIHSLTNCYDVEPDDLWQMSDIDVMNKLFWNLEDILSHFSMGGDNKQTYQMKHLREYRLTGKFTPKPEKVDPVDVPDWLDNFDPDEDDNDGQVDNNDDNREDDADGYADYGNKYHRGDYLVANDMGRREYGAFGDQMILGQVEYQQDEYVIHIKILAHKNPLYIGKEDDVESQYYKEADDALVRKYFRGELNKVAVPIREQYQYPNIDIDVEYAARKVQELHDAMNEALKYKHQFKIGDMITGKEGSHAEYGVTNEFMYVGQVTSLADNDNIFVKVLHHRYAHYNGEEAMVKEGYFVPARPGKILEYKRLKEDEREGKDNVFKPDMDRFKQRRGYWDVRYYDGKPVMAKQFGLKVLRNSIQVGDYLVGKPGNGYGDTSDKEIVKVLAFVGEDRELVSVKIIYSLKRHWLVGNEMVVDPTKFYNVMYR